MKAQPSCVGFTNEPATAPADPCPAVDCGQQGLTNGWHLLYLAHRFRKKICSLPREMRRSQPWAGFGRKVSGGNSKGQGPEVGTQLPFEGQKVQAAGAGRKEVGGRTWSGDGHAGPGRRGRVQTGGRPDRSDHSARPEVPLGRIRALILRDVGTLHHLDTALPTWVAQTLWQKTLVSGQSPFQGG